MFFKPQQTKMKKYLNLFLALVVSSAFTACKDYEEFDNNSVFLFSASCDFNSHDNEETVEEQRAIVNNALKEVGFSLDDFTMELTGSDSAAVNSILQKKMARVEEIIKSDLKVRVTLGVKGAMKKYMKSDNDKKHPICQWYHNEMYPANSDTPNGTTTASGLHSNYHQLQWVKRLRTEEHFFDPGGSNSYSSTSVKMGFDTNYGMGGDYISLMLETSGSYEDKFVWEDSYSNQYITDVIAVYGGGEPQTIFVEGRLYKKQNAVADLNKKAEGEYIWLYTTTDPVYNYRGYYLNTGEYGDKNYCCRMIGNYDDYILAKNYLHQPYVRNGHRFVERVVQAYHTNGYLEGELDTNYREKKHKFIIRMILTYATKEAGY